jgi:hypothetical protein
VRGNVTIGVGATLSTPSSPRTRSATFFATTSTAAGRQMAPPLGPPQSIPIEV